MALNHKIIGEGEPVIIMHGLFGMLDNWQSVAKMLSEKYMVILVDLRNHGKSFHSEDWSISVMAEDVRIFMEENWIYHASILGHSMGGKVAMELALKEPDLVDKLIVVDIAPKAYAPGHDQIFDALNSIPIDQISSREEATEILSSKIDQLGIVHFLLKNIARKKEGGYRWKMNLQTITENYDTIIEATKISETYDGETLFIRGSDSNYILKEDEDLIKRIFTNAQIKTIEGAGHWVHADKRDEFVKVVESFLG
jgi:pimeloyl-ACP methyl ester carboxylesterase